MLHCQQFGAPQFGAPHKGRSLRRGSVEKLQNVAELMDTVTMDGKKSANGKAVVGTRVKPLP